jgi:hypothetical protein
MFSNIGSDFIVQESVGMIINSWNVTDSNQGISLVNGQDYQVSSGGLYLITYSVQFQTVAGGQRDVEILKNGVIQEAGRMTINSNTDQVTGPNVANSAMFNLITTDVISIRVRQTSNSNVTIHAGSFQICKL